MNDSLDKVIFTWGKFKGYTLGNVRRTSPQYLQWIVNTDGILDVWREAARRAINDEDVSDLSLPRIDQDVGVKRKFNTDIPINVYLKDKDTAYVVMSYNKLLIERFKYEIDGRKWNPEEKRWEFPAVHLPKVASSFPSAVFSTKAKQLLDQLNERRSDLDEIRQLEDTEFKINGLLLDLYDFQRVGVRFIDRADGRCLVADAPGLGKTVQAIAYGQYHSLKTLVVCPLSVVINWQKEIKKFLGKPSTVWDTKHYHGDLNNQFHITHYDAVSKISDKLRKEEFDLLVCDEATYLKNRRTLRAKSILGSWKERRKFPGIKTDHVIFLTGTPVMSRPVEAFSLLNFLDKNRFNNFYHFVQRYGGWRGSAPMNLTDLHDRTKDLVIRRKKSQVLTELPEKQRNDLYVEMTKQEKEEYNKLLQELFGKWRADGKPSVKHMPKLQSFLIDKKIPRLRELIAEYLDNDEKLLIFCCYVNPLKQLKEELGDIAALYHGSMKKEEREFEKNRLADGNAKIGLFSLKASGMGIDGLQHSIHTVIFLDHDWVPANHEQAEDRTHRIGQKNQVQAYYMICDGSIDEYMRDIIKEKQVVADMIVDGELVTPERNKSIFREFVKRISLSHDEPFDIQNIED